MLDDRWLLLKSLEVKGGHTTTTRNGRGGGEHERTHRRLQPMHHLEIT